MTDSVGIESTSDLKGDNLWSAFEKLTKLAAGAAAMSYVVGLLVVNVYLWSVGVSSFALLKIRFMYTGAVVIIWLLVTIFLSILGLIIHLNPSEERKAETTTVRILQNFLLSPIGETTAKIILWALLLGLPLLFGNRMFTGHIWLVRLEVIRTIFPAYVRMLAVSAFLCVIWFISSGKLDQYLFLSTARDRKMFVLVFSFGALIFFSGYIREFAHGIYPILPEQAGGGKPRQVQVAFDHSRSQTFELLGIPICRSSGLTGKVDLIFEDEDSIVLGNGSGRVTQIKKELIYGMTSTPVTCGNP